MGGAPRAVLLGNELGRGLGHVGKLLLVADDLAALGFTPVLALRDPAAARPATDRHPFRVCQAPPLPPRAPSADGPIGSMAEILLRAGFADPERAAAVVAAWDALLAELDPCLVVTDFAPFLGLSAFAAVPVVALGTGFTLPPPHLAPFPRFLPTAPPTPDPDLLLADTIATLQTRRRRPHPSTPAEMVAGTRHFVCTAAELDPYAPLREEPAAGPLAPPPTPPDAPGSGLFVYLTAEAPRTPAILAGVQSAQVPGTCYVRGGGAPLGGGIEWLARPAPLDEALEGARLVVHHGGVNTLLRALLFGRVQLVVSAYQEQAMSGVALERLEAGQLIRSDEQTPARIAGAIRSLIGDERRRQRAREWGRTLCARHPAGALPAVVEACRRLAL